MLGTDSADALEPLRERYSAQHHSLRKFYYECSNLKYLTGLINVPKLGQDPPNLFDSGDAPSLPARPASKNLQTLSPPPTAPTPTPTAAEVSEQARILAQYEAQQAQLTAQREADERARQEQEAAQQREYEELQRQQAERERQAQEMLVQNQMQAWNDQAAAQANELQRQMLAMQGQYERDQLLLEQYDRVSPLNRAAAVLSLT
jgi:hypothetical protein